MFAIKCSVGLYEWPTDEYIKQENTFKYVVCKVVAILFQPQCVEWNLNLQSEYEIWVIEHAAESFIFIRCSKAETKWLPFSRRQFQKHFLEWKCSNFD